MAARNAVLGSIAGHVICIILFATSVAGATTVRIAPDRPSPQWAGTAIRWTVTMSDCDAPCSFKWWLDAGSGKVLVQDWSTSQVWTWTPAVARAGYRITVWVRGAGNNEDRDEADTNDLFDITERPQVTAVGLTASPQSAQAIGTAIRFAAAPVGGVQPYTYAWFVYEGNAWRLAREFSPDATFTWQPQATGSYRVRVDVRGAGDTTDAPGATNQMGYVITVPTITALTLGSDLAAPQQAGTSITWTASASGGTPPYTYRWWVHDGREWTALQGWSASPQLVWNPLTAGAAYRVMVWARSAGNTVDAAEAQADRPFVIDAARCPITVSPSTIAIGNGDGGGTVRVSAPAGCTWEVRSRASWLTLASAASGTGPGAVAFRVAPNPFSAARDSTLSIGGRALPVVQAGASAVDGCSFSVYPSSLALDAGNRTVSVAVTAPAGCRWTADTNAAFLHPTPPGATGSGAVSVQVDTNAADDARAGVVLVAGRAVTIAQSGASAPAAAACAVTASPVDVSAASGGRAGTITVSAPAGCAWAVGGGAGFLHLSTTSGSGSGQVSYTVDPNGGVERTAVLTIGGSTVTLTQAPAPVVPACAYALSSAAWSVSHAGGSSSVAIFTGAGCAWVIDERTSWIHVVEQTPGNGPGTVWFSVEANPEESTRRGTLVVAGQPFTITQAPPPTTVSASAVTWEVAADPARVGQCEGNCGAGCGTFFNPCGGPHYWEHQVLGTPQYVGDDWEPVCSNGSAWIAVRPRFTALARWTYHGLRSSNCVTHDATCRALNLIPFLPADKVLCLATAGVVGLNGLSYCADAAPFDWSYDFVDVGHGAAVAYLDGGGACN